MSDRCEDDDPPEISLEAWAFHTKEISANVYHCIGTGPRGMRVESTDTDPAKAFEDCRAFARRYPV